MLMFGYSFCYLQWHTFCVVLCLLLKKINYTHSNFYIKHILTLKIEFVLLRKWIFQLKISILRSKIVSIFQIGDHVDLASSDVSRRDFQMWLRRLPLKLSSVTRREFLNEEYLDCESCDELTDDKVTNPSRAKHVHKCDIYKIVELEKKKGAEPSCSIF